jgi:hypothetical protein
LALTWLDERSTPSLISGCEDRCSVTTNAASSAATPAKEPSVRAEAHPALCAETTVNTSSSIDAVPVTAPGRS